MQTAETLRFRRQKRLIILCRSASTGKKRSMQPGQVWQGSPALCMSVWRRVAWLAGSPACGRARAAGLLCGSLRPGILRSLPLLTWHKVPKRPLPASGMAVIWLRPAWDCRTGSRLLYAARCGLRRATTRQICDSACPGRMVRRFGVLLLTFPGQSNDLGDYSFRAHMLVHLSRNP